MFQTHLVWSKFLNCLCWTRKWLVFQTINDAMCMIALLKQERSNVEWLCFCWAAIATGQWLLDWLFQSYFSFFIDSLCIWSTQWVNWNWNKRHHYVIWCHLELHRISCPNMCYDLVGSGHREHWLWDIARALIVRYSQKKEWIVFVFYCLRILQSLRTFEPLVRFRWGLQQNVPLHMSTSIK